MKGKHNNFKRRLLQFGGEVQWLEPAGHALNFPKKQADLILSGPIN
jgi:hypothetical protein